MKKEASEHHHEDVAPVVVLEKIGGWVGQELVRLKEEYQGSIDGPGTRRKDKFAWRRVGKLIDEYCEELSLSRPKKGPRGYDLTYQDVPLAATSYDNVIAYIRAEPGTPKADEPKRVSLTAIWALLDVLEHRCCEHKGVMTHAEREDWEHKFVQANRVDVLAEAAAEEERLKGRRGARGDRGAQFRETVPEGWKPGWWAVAGPPEIRRRGGALTAEVPLADPEGQAVTASGMSAVGDWDAIRNAILATIPNTEELENIRWYYVLDGQLTSDVSRPTCQLDHESGTLTGRGQQPGSSWAVAEAIIEIVNQLLSLNERHA